VSLRVGQEVQALSRRLAASERLSELRRSDRPVHVAVAVVIDRRGRVLIAERPAGKQLAGAWEFPGGKIEPGETPRQGLARELEEEIGITFEHPRPLMRLRHTYPTGEVLLDVWVVRRYRGEPRGLDGQRLRWCDRGALTNARLLPADRPILAALRLPERLRRSAARWYTANAFEAFSNSRGVIAQPDCAARAGAAHGTDAERLEGVLCEDIHEAQAAATAGADFLAIKTALAPAELAALCERVSVPVFAHGISPRRAWAQGASGINAIPG
jgi:mutator protein MutT